jgi:histidine ammonia-lyase
MPSPLRLDLNAPLTIADVASVAREGRVVTLGTRARAGMERARRVVEAHLSDGHAHYGINTGFGSLAKQRISDTDLATLQRNLIRSHSAGAGDPLPEEIVRAMMLVLAASLARGHSGVRPLLVETLLDMLKSGLTPEVPSIGSVGASGDLAPLAHVALAMLGEGYVKLDGRRMPAARALARAKIQPVTLAAKEGLALINGTHLMAGSGAIVAHDAAILIDAAASALAMSIDACRATDAFLDARLYEARNHQACADVASVVHARLDGSQIVVSHVENDPRVQDPYSLRAGPTVLGAALDALRYVAGAMTSELQAVTDNPLVFPDSEKDQRRIVSGANFHGMPVAIPLDILAIPLAHIAGVSERRTYLITGAFEPESHLKPFLAPRPGLQSGLMIAQYTAAACVNELVGLASPASVANVPTCAGMEDYNSFGPRSAAKARRAIELTRIVVAIELLCASQGIEHHRPLRSGRGVEGVHRAIRRVVTPQGEDRPLMEPIHAIAGLIERGTLREAAGRAPGASGRGLELVPAHDDH